LALTQHLLQGYQEYYISSTLVSFQNIPSPKEYIFVLYLASCHRSLFLVSFVTPLLRLHELFPPSAV
jgi:hypothetical protein